MLAGIASHTLGCSWKHPTKDECAFFSCSWCRVWSMHAASYIGKQSQNSNESHLQFAGFLLYKCAQWAAFWSVWRLNRISNSLPFPQNCKMQASCMFPCMNHTSLQVSNAQHCSGTTSKLWNKIAQTPQVLIHLQFWSAPLIFWRKWVKLLNSHCSCKKRRLDPDNQGPDNQYLKPKFLACWAPLFAHHMCHRHACVPCKPGTPLSVIDARSLDNWSLAVTKLPMCILCFCPTVISQHTSCSVLSVRKVNTVFAPGGTGLFVVKWIKSPRKAGCYLPWALDLLLFELNLNRLPHLDIPYPVALACACACRPVMIL